MYDNESKLLNAGTMKLISITLERDSMTKTYIAKRRKRALQL